ncbi:MAG: hypothetical protein IJT45_04970 [Bacteroidales bacterium]|nr:hypothetical protein [Bacteroidales bacterium]
MKTIFKISNAILAILMVFFVISCNKKPVNQIDINVDIDFTIYPNTLEYQELNVVGGYMYLTSPLPSYGIIVYKKSYDEFMAYDRKPLIDNESCPNNRLVVDLPFIVDECNDQRYNILDGSNLNEDGTHLYWYQTEFDGTALRIYN